MKTRNIFSALLGFSLMFSACNSEDVDYAAPSAKTPGVHLRLTGAATGNTTSRATVEAEEGEKTVNSLVAVLFDTHEGFYKTVSATCINEATNEYTFIVEKDATYDIWLVANASDKLKGELENIPEGTKMEDENGLNYLESITADQAPDEEGNFLMVSKYSEKVTTHITESQSIGEVHMIRLAARFDLLNKAEGVTVTNIEFANRTVKSAVLTPNTMNNASHWFEKKDYSLNVTGDPENGTAWNGQIYTYENHSEAESEQTPTLTITYYEGDDATETKTHEVKLIDPNSTTGKTMPIKRNNLYRIILTKATKLDFDLQVLDWDDEEAEIEHPEVPLILPKDVQDSLNRQLLVYDLFAEYNVKSIDFDNKTVEFFDTYVFPTDDSYKSSFYSYNDIKSKNALNATFKDENNNFYRLALPGEVQLLAPIIGRIDDNGASYWGNPEFNAQRKPMIASEFKEDVYFKVNNEQRDKSCDISSENPDGFSGVTQLKIGRNSIVYSLSANNEYTNDPKLVTKKVVVNTVYGIRFKGTSQYAAYKWEPTYVNNDETNRALAIYIKALPKDSDITIDDIIDNHTYWNDDDCIKITIPMAGSYSYQNLDNRINYGSAASIITNCLIDRDINPGVTGSFRFTVALNGEYRTGVINSENSVVARYLLHLVKVKETENESGK